MNTTTTDTAPKPAGRVCVLCGGKKTVKHYRSGFSTQVLRCGCCKGTGTITAEKWLKAYTALPRPVRSRAEAIARACHLLNRQADGTPDPTRYGVEILPNGFGGLMVDLLAAGYADVAARAKAAYLADRTCETEAQFDAFVAEVVAARSELPARRS